MRDHRLKCLLVFALALCAQRASAFMGPPYIAPAKPMAGDTISVNVYRDECDVLNIGIVPPVIEQHGSNITIVSTGIHEGDPEWCLYGTGIETVVIGSYQPGAYTLDVERRYMTVFGTWTQETLGVIPFSVSGAPPRPPIKLPALNRKAFASLLLAVIAAALLALVPRKV